MIRADALKFLDNYVRLRDLRIRPLFCVNPRTDHVDVLPRVLVAELVVRD